MRTDGFERKFILYGKLAYYTNTYFIMNNILIQIGHVCHPMTRKMA